MHTAAKERNGMHFPLLLLEVDLWINDCDVREALIPPASRSFSFLAACICEPRSGGGAKHGRSEDIGADLRGGHGLRAIILTGRRVPRVAAEPSVASPGGDWNRRFA